ncbi:MAG: response regulator [Mycobacteriales bacterium]
MNDDTVRIVVVDDSADSAQTMAVLLRLSGYDVRTAGSGQDALALIEDTAPHCVIFDVVMPASTATNSATACAHGTGTRSS